MRKINNNFEMDMLIAKHAENKFLNFEFFSKEVENAENMSKYILLDFFIVFFYFWFKKKTINKMRSKSGYDRKK